ncbi:ribosome small subunit-dependent GTPase A [Chitinophaga parva]|uniref:Small ribosomal subunit biogenesis GTPase RsgA n=1 Tax=Chitinophaga parva TaxID=2169414 RepID=A0A2T7BMC0_9BACT|nr:ribosome small subunit-dependent GTPase A [Chitinophaga parva]PUZ28827.1 ribosome small subunit-dependent GTPase A [Chitinophaga parva]
MEARIYKSTGSWYVAKGADGTTFKARMKGVFKNKDITSTNPVAVGDYVEIEMEQGDAMITGIHDRRNYIVRESPHGRVKKHIVASNMDQAILVTTVASPRTSQGFMDRFLVTAAAYHIPVILLFNKKDIYREKEIEQYALYEDMYSEIGYTVRLVSATDAVDIAMVKDLLAGKTTLLSGHSGVGKSTLINGVLPASQLKTHAVSGWSGKGQHTTTFAEMFDLEDGGSLIDTPGIRELGIVDIDKAELSHYFLEMQPYISQCRFSSCLHLNEPGCAVRAAVDEGKIYPERYVSYVTILSTLDDKGY